MSTKSNNCVIQYTFARAPQILPALGTLQVKNFQDLCLVLDPMLQAAVGLLLFRSSGFARFDMSIGLYRCIPRKSFAILHILVLPILLIMFAFFVPVPPEEAVDNINSKARERRKRLGREDFSESLQGSVHVSDNHLFARYSTWHDNQLKIDLLNIDSDTRILWQAMRMVSILHRLQGFTIQMTESQTKRMM